MKPKYIYKYLSFTDDNLSSMENKKIYFQKPNKFNDIFDCKVATPKLELSNEEYLVQFDYFIKDKKNREKYNFSSHIDPKFHDELHKILAKNSHLEIERMNNMHYISCFSETYDNILMWAHYGDNNKGFCLEFDTSYSFFNDMYKVEYLSEPYKLNIYDFFKGSSTNILPILTRKYNIWEYEKEWRIISQDLPQLKEFPAVSLKAIYFGHKTLMDNADKAYKLATSVIRYQPHVKFYAPDRSSVKYELKFKEYIFKI